MFSGLSTSPHPYASPIGSSPRLITVDKRAQLSCHLVILGICTLVHVVRLTGNYWYGTESIVVNSQFSILWSAKLMCRSVSYRPPYYLLPALVIP